MQLSEQQLAAIVSMVDSSDDAIVAKDLRSVITSWNRGAERLFGYPAAEAVGQSIFLIIPEDRRHEEDRVMTTIRTGERVRPFETVRRRRDGTLVHVSIAVSPIHDASGAIVGASKIVRDITDRKRAEDRLAFLAEVGGLLTSSLDYSQTLDRAVHIALPRLGDYCNVMLLDEPGTLRHVAAGHVDRAREPIVRELAVRAIERRGLSSTPSFAETIVKTGRTHVVSHEQLTRLAETIDVSTLDPEVVRLGGELQAWAFAGAPLQVLGRTVGVISFGTTARESRREFGSADVTLLEEFARRVSMAMENARLFRETQELNRLKDEFLATLSHEMRTPLSAILGWARILASEQVDPERAKQAIDAIMRNAQAQAKIVDDVLDVARGMAGSLRLDTAPTDLVTVAERGVEGISPAASAKKIAVELRAPAPVPIVADAGRLQQVVWNLLTNAVKFTPHGGRVCVEVDRHDAYGELRVSDTGAGIPREFLPFVFDKFRQADASASRQHGGLGLGLAIARRLTEMHGGSIEAHSGGEGRGATFIVRLPLRIEG